MAIAIAGCLLSPRDAQAQYSGASVDMNVLMLALQDDPGALATLNAALGSPPAPYDMYAYLDGVRAALGDPPRINAVPPPPINPPTNSVAQLTGAAAGTVGNLNTVQNALGGPFFYNYFSYLDPYLGTVYPLAPINTYDDLINWTIAGTGNTALQTLAQAMAGQAGAINTLSIVLYNSPTQGTWALFQTLLCSQFGSCANAQSIIALAASGDAAAQAQLNTYLGSVILSNNTSGMFDAEGITWIISLGAGAVTGTNCLLDTDADGVPDCTDPDIDGDGTPNQLDLDIDGDGVADNPDTDGDGIPDSGDPTPTGGPPVGGGGGGGGGTGAGGTGGGGTAGGGSTPPTNDCDSGASAPLTGSFGTDPCELAEDTLAMVDDTYWDVAGEQFVDHLNELWTEQMLPSLKNMTAQWHASVVDQTRQFGSTVDSHDLTKQIKQTQVREVEAKKRVTPNERACVSATPASPMAVTQSTSNALTSGFREDTVARSGGAPGTPAEQGNQIEKKSRLATYCTQFNDPEANAGVNPCPNPTTAGPWPNGDIDIEGFLFKDTIDLSKPEQYAAAHEILTNLIEPNTADKLTPDVIDTQSGQEYILRREQIESWRGVASNMIASMMSRRTSIPLPQSAGGATPPPTPPPPPPPPPPPAAGTPTASAGTFDDWLRTLGAREASGRIGVCNADGYCGLYQMGQEALIEAGCISSSSGPRSREPNNYSQPNYNWSPSATCPCGTSMKAFLADGNCQYLAVNRYQQRQWSFIAPSCRAMALACQTVNGVRLTPSGMLAGAHLMGAGGIHCLLGCGVCNPSATSLARWNSKCGGIPCDKSGTKITEYINRMAGFDVPFAGGPSCGRNAAGTSVSTGSPPPPPKPVGQTIREIRERAGVDPANISDNPSYNEIMLAMTKERFLDPDYYARMQADIGALMQEQASVKAYVTMQLQDIYEIQEHINVLMAARAAMKLNEGSQGAQERSELMPVR